MEVKQAKRKKNTAPNNFGLFPPADSKAVIAYFTGSSCVVKDVEDMVHPFNMGGFGKGSLSRSEPNFNHNTDGLPEVLNEPQWQNRLAYPNSVASKISDTKMKLCSDTMQDLFHKIQNKPSGSWKDLKTENSSSNGKNNHVHWSLHSEPASFSYDSGFAQMVNAVIESKVPMEVPLVPEEIEVLVVGGEGGPKLETATSAISEVLALNLQEAFYLSQALGKLTILNDKDEVMDAGTIWTDFSNAETNFIERYVIYHWYRSRGWVVRSGTKYGGDFLLYVKGPSFYHSSCLVKILGEGLSLQWLDLQRWQRLVETVKKDVLLVTAIPPENLTDRSKAQPEIIKEYKVREVIVRRWIPSQQRSK